MKRTPSRKAGRGSGLALAVALAACWLSLAPAWAADPAAACDANQFLLPAGKTLPHLARALRDGSRLDILAVGSATLLGPHMGVAGSFPARAAQLLRAARPGWDVRLVTYAERGASAVELLAILRRQIAAHPSALVLWQTGTTEAARGSPPVELGNTLQEGVQAALASGSDMVLIDPPFSRLLTSRADLDRYNPAFLKAAAAPGVALFSRYDLMRHWVDSGQLDLERAPAADRRATLARLHECLAMALTHGLLAAAQAPATTASR